MDIQSTLEKLEKNIKDNSENSKKLFERLKRLQDCYKYTISNLTKKETQRVAENIKKNDVSKTEEICDTLLKYLKNIQDIPKTKEDSQNNIKHVVSLMKDKVDEIVKTEPEDEPIGSLHTFQLEHIAKLKDSLDRDMRNDCCNEIQRVKDIVTSYYERICIELEKYTEEIKKLNKNSKNYTKVLNKIYEYRSLYKRLVLYIKHYKMVNREEIIACEKKGNMTDVEKYLDEVEKYLKYRISIVHKFIQSVKS